MKSGANSSKPARTVFKSGFHSLLILSRCDRRYRRGRFARPSEFRRPRSDPDLAAGNRTGAINQKARSLGVETVAEGIETPDHAES
jgi:hypothetical protein